jgi:hypothetical protein
MCIYMCIHYKEREAVYYADCQINHGPGTG